MFSFDIKRVVIMCLFLLHTNPSCAECKAEGTLIVPDQEPGLTDRPSGPCFLVLSPLAILVLSRHLLSLMFLGFLSRGSTDNSMSLI